MRQSGVLYTRPAGFMCGGLTTTCVHRVGLEFPYPKLRPPGVSGAGPPARSPRGGERLDAGHRRGQPARLARRRGCKQAPLLGRAGRGRALTPALVALAVRREAVRLVACTVT